jgi:hypothetical protein
LKEKLNLYFDFIKINRHRVELINKKYHIGDALAYSPSYSLENQTYWVYGVNRCNDKGKPTHVLEFRCCDAMIKKVYFSYYNALLVVVRQVIWLGRKRLGDGENYTYEKKCIHYTFTDLNSVVTWFIDLCERDVDFNHFKGVMYVYYSTTFGYEKRLPFKCLCYNKQDKKEIQCYNRFVGVPKLESICMHFLSSLFYNNRNLIRAILPPNFPDVFTSSTIFK